MPPSTTRRASRPAETRWAQDADTSHRFAVGQRVRLKGGFGRPSDASGVYRITARLPSQDSSPQYRIRGDGELHERVAQQESLELVASATLPDENTALIERTFGHGQ